MVGNDEILDINDEPIDTAWCAQAAASDEKGKEEDGAKQNRTDIGVDVGFCLFWRFPFIFTLLVCLFVFLVFVQVFIRFLIFTFPVGHYRFLKFY